MYADWNTTEPLKRMKFCHSWQHEWQHGFITGRHYAAWNKPETEWQMLTARSHLHVESEKKKISHVVETKS